MSVLLKTRTILSRNLESALNKVRRVGEDQALHDIERERQRQALASTARFVDEHLSHVEPEPGSPAREAQLSLLRRAVNMAPENGLILEFGVATGLTLREIAARRLPAHGFDSFEGLPEYWRPGFATGAFSQGLPDVGGANLHVGLFADTLPAFLEEYRDPFAFVHMDADLYSSTKIVFDLARDRFISGTLILFDEYFNYPGWEQHEHRALSEFIAASGRKFEYIGYNPIHEQVLVLITA